MVPTSEITAGRAGTLWLDGLDPQTFTVKAMLPDGAFCEFYNHQADSTWFDYVEDWLADGYTIEWSAA